MLNKRTQILFDNHLWRELTSLAESQKTSVGNLVRQAVTKTYFVDGDGLKKDRIEAVAEIRKFREKYGKKDREDSVTIIRKMREERTTHLLNVLR